MRHMPYRFAAALLAACAFAPPAMAQLVFVGPASDPDCDYETIQQAVDAWAASPSSDFVTVFIANAQAWPAQAITIPTPVASSGIGLRGEFPGCRLEAQGGQAVLDGAGGAGGPTRHRRPTTAPTPVQSTRPCAGNRSAMSAATAARA